VQVDATCPDCGEPLRVIVRDGRIEEATPQGIRGYTNVPLRRWAEDWAVT
jgi:hypothetical protein